MDGLLEHLMLKSCTMAPAPLDFATSLNLLAKDPQSSHFWTLQCIAISIGLLINFSLYICITQLISTKHRQWHASHKITQMLGCMFGQTSVSWCHVADVTRWEELASCCYKMDVGSRLTTQFTIGLGKRRRRSFSGKSLSHNSTKSTPSNSQL